MRDRSPVADKRSRDRDAFDVDEEEELYERKKLERKLREKEAAYQEVVIFKINYSLDNMAVQTTQLFIN